jgi:hypothetical protein
MQTAECWQLHLTLPPEAHAEKIPGPIWDFLVILVHAYAARTGAQPPASRAAAMHLEVPLEHPALWLDTEVARHLRALLEELVGCRQRIAPATATTATAVRCQVTAAESSRPSASPGAVLAFSPDLDSIAALAEWLASDMDQHVDQRAEQRVDRRMEQRAGQRVSQRAGQRAPSGAAEPVLVGIDISGRARSRVQAGERLLASLFHAHGPRLASLVLIPPEASASAEPALPPDGWRLLHVVATAAVAMSLGAAEASFFENGVANLGLPVTLSALAHPAARSLHPTLMVELEQLLGRLSGSPFRVRNPFVGHTPAEVVEHMVVATGDAARLDEICDLLQGVSQPERAIDQRIAALGGQRARAPDAPASAEAVPGELIASMNEDVADAYVRALRELPALSDGELLPRLRPSSAARLIAQRRDGALLVDLARRHGAQVQRALTSAARAGAQHLVAGTLAPSSLLARAVLSRRGLEGGPPARAPLFRKCTDRWEIWFEDGAPLYLNHARGLAYIHLLLQEPGRAYTAAELRAHIAGHFDVPSGAIGELADRQAIIAYKMRLDDLRAELDVANDNHDFGQRERIEEELEAIEAELRRCLTHTGRPRQVNDSERARKAVSIAMHRTLRRIEEVHPRLARHLSASLQIGIHLRYLPARPIPWVTS